MVVGNEDATGSRFWNSENFDLDDDLNRQIWEQSAQLQTSIQPQQEMLTPGAVGAQQAMVSYAVLPWVPDIVGKDYMGPDGVLIVGSAYAGFIRERSGRNKSLPLDEYRSSRTAAEFQEKFLRSVVEGDGAYYQKIRRRAETQWRSSQIALFDLCRVSFVRRRGPNQRDESGDKVVRSAPSTFDRYVANPKSTEWIWQRIVRSEATKIIALGTIAEHGLLRIFDLKQMTIADDAGVVFRPVQSAGGSWVLRYAHAKRKLSYGEKHKAGWKIVGIVNGKSRLWHLCPRYHPAAQTKRSGI